MEFALRHHVEGRDGAGGRQKQRQVQIEHLEPALIKANNHGRQKHHGEQDHQGVGDVGGQVERGLQLDRERLRAPPDAGEQFLGALDQPLGPARLLLFEGIHLDRKLRRTLDARVIDEFPAFKLGAVAQVGVLGQRVLLPTARILDCRPPPHPRRAIEVEKAA